jgi:hypothetical protein
MLYSEWEKEKLSESERFWKSETAALLEWRKANHLLEVANLSPSVVSPLRTFLFSF